LVVIATEHGPCSVRHIYYRAVVAGLVAKTNAGYAMVQRDLLQLRRDHTIPYTLIVDSSRSAYFPEVWDDLDGLLDHVAATYRRDLWTRSPYRVEVWAESESISGTILPTANAWAVPVYPCRGQSSETFAWKAAETWKQTPNRTPVVLYIGDHDPAGLEIEESLLGKLGSFTETVFPGIDWTRIGVTWEQVEAFDLPGTKPKKAYGYPYSVEAEALPPRTLITLLDRAISNYADQHDLDVLLAAEESERDILAQLIYRETTP